MKGNFTYRFELTLRLQTGTVVPEINAFKQTIQLYISIDYNVTRLGRQSKIVTSLDSYLQTKQNMHDFI